MLKSSFFGYFCTMIQRNFFGGGGMPPVTKNLIIINVIVWLAEIVPSLRNAIPDYLGLHYFTASDFFPFQLITYMFVHDSGTPLHIFFNMFTLWMFGRMLERVWGSQRFLVFYFICGIGAALVQEAVWALTWENDYISLLGHLNGQTFETTSSYVAMAVSQGDADIIANMDLYCNNLITVGASGAVFGLLLGFAFVFPNLPLYLFFIPIPIKAKYMVIGYGILEFFLGVAGKGGTVAHFAHLGGMLFGLIILLYWKKKGTLGGNFFY